MSHYVVIGGYLLWKYYYIVEYTYSALYYTNAVRHIIFDKKKEKEKESLSDDWILCEEGSPTVIV
jgi:hypothetical protein